MGTIVGVVPYHKIGRAIVPLNGTAGDRAYRMSATVTVGQNKSSSTRTSLENVTYPIYTNPSGEREVKHGYYERSSTGISASITGGGDRSIRGQIRLADLIRSLTKVEMTKASVNNFSFHHTSNSRHISHEGESLSWEDTTGGPSGGSTMLDITVQLVSGCDHFGVNRLSAYMTPKVRADIAMGYTANGTRYSKSALTGEITSAPTNHSGSISGSINTAMPGIKIVSPDTTIFSAIGMRYMSGRKEFKINSASSLGSNTVSDLDWVNIWNSQQAGGITLTWEGSTWYNGATPILGGSSGKTILSGSREHVISQQYKDDDGTWQSTGYSNKTPIEGIYDDPDGSTFEHLKTYYQAIFSNIASDTSPPAPINNTDPWWDIHGYENSGESSYSSISSISLGVA